jgi:hypothetical protein
MEKQRIALVEFGGSHDECLLTQMEALQSAGREIFFVTNERLYERNPHLHRFCSGVHFVEPTGRAIGDVLLMRRLVRRLAAEGVAKIVFNTAQGGHVRNLALLLSRRMKAYGIIHTVRKFQGSFTQKVIHRKIKKYVVLSDDLRERIYPPSGISVGSFYPVSFPHFDHQPPEKPAGEVRIAITGGVENRRKDLAAVIGFIQQTPETVQFVFLGKTDPDHVDAQAFLQRVELLGLKHRIRYFTEFVPHERFDVILRETDFLLPLIHPGTPSADEYISNQISGAFTIAFGYTIPLLIHEQYSTEDDLRISAHFYTEDTFAQELKEAVSRHAELQARIAAEEKWTKAFQYRNYLRFLDIEVERIFDA